MTAMIARSRGRHDGRGSTTAGPDGDPISSATDIWSAKRIFQNAWAPPFSFSLIFLLVFFSLRMISSPNGPRDRQSRRAGSVRARTEPESAAAAFRLRRISQPDIWCDPRRAIRDRS
jgi:hypothetical protein